MKKQLQTIQISTDAQVSDKIETPTDRRHRKKKDKSLTQNETSLEVEHVTKLTDSFETERKNDTVKGDRKSMKGKKKMLDSEKNSETEQECEPTNSLELLEQKEIVHANDDTKSVKQSKRKTVTFDLKIETEQESNSKLLAQNEEVSNEDDHNTVTTEKSKKKRKRKEATVSETHAPDEHPECSSKIIDKSKKKKKKRKHDLDSNEVDIKKQKEENSKDNSDARGEKAIIYLKNWKFDRSNWKFQKVSQIWLLKNMLQSDKVAEADFPLLLEYLIDLKGLGRKFATELCETEIKKVEEISTEESELPSSYYRARAVMQHLQ